MSLKMLFLDSVSGVAGDMFSAAFVDAGIVSEELLSSIPKKIGLTGVSVQFKKVMRASVLTTHLDVVIEDDTWKPLFDQKHTHSRIDANELKKAVFEKASDHVHANLMGDSHWHSHFVAIDGFLAKANLKSEVKDFARAVFRKIAVAESHAHGVPLDEVAFHEIGTIDSILDVVMAATCLSEVQAEQVLATPLRLGRGFLKIAHGTHPIPPPATAKIVEGLPVRPVPTAIERESVELTTPTGAAILATLFEQKRLSFVEEIPAGTVVSMGAGSGTADFGAFPNVFRVGLLQKSEVQNKMYFQDQVLEIAFNIDDEPGEKTAWVCEQLFELGALDVWLTPAMGKKGRVANVIQILCAIEKKEFLIDWILKNSSTFGLRYKLWDRAILDRKFEEKQTPTGPVRIKVALDRQGNVVKSKVEFEDFKRQQLTKN